MTETLMLPCPFCNMKVDLTDLDVLYPSGAGWKDNVVEGCRTYHRYFEVPKEQWCWQLNCPTTSGGCGCNMSADSREEVIDKWNKRA